MSNQFMTIYNNNNNNTKIIMTTRTVIKVIIINFLMTLLFILDYFVRVCLQNGTADVCTRCPEETTLAYGSNSFHLKSCYNKPSCAQFPGKLTTSRSPGPVFLNHFGDIYLFLTPNSRSVFRAGVSLNIHSFILGNKM